MAGGVRARKLVTDPWAGNCVVQVVIGQDADGNRVWQTATQVTGADVSNPGGGGPPPPPSITGSMPTRTSSSIAWAIDPSFSGAPVTSWDVQRRQDGGAWATVSGSPFAAATTTLSQTGLATATPEILWEYQVRGINGDGTGDWSSAFGLQWQTTVQNGPTAPTNTSWGEVTDTTAIITWDASTDSAVIDQRITNGTVVLASGIGASVRQFTVTGLTVNTAYTNIQVSRRNLSGFSTKSAAISITPRARVLSPIMGCSASDNDHGGTEDWDAWRVYTRSAMLSLANRTGTTRPVALAYSVDGPPLGSNGNVGVSTMTYTAVYDYVKSELDNFYYGGTGQTHSARWGIKLYWLNGNENSDKGSNTLALPHTAAGIANFVTSQRALYDAVHLIDATTGNRRYPDARAGSDPTQNHELSGIVADWLHPSARYHDFVVWSMYPAGRGAGLDDPHSTDPRYDWPSFKESDRTSRQPGFLIRCFYRTAQAQAQARIDRNDPTFELEIGCGEVGIASDPSDHTTRPYYATHAIWGGIMKLAQQYDISLGPVLWWDNMTSTRAPHNILSDEPPNSDHGGDNTKTANPSTREAWQNAPTYNKQFGGTVPTQWTGNPKATWDQTGQSI